MSYFITEKCIGCTLCARSCPVEAISGAVKERHRINEKRCVDCGVCGNVCSAGAVQNDRGETAVKLPKAAWKKPVVDTGRCSACAMCVDWCGKEALAISPPLFRGDIQVYARLEEPKKCVGCGICAQVCPLHAIVMKEAEA